MLRTKRWAPYTFRAHSAIKYGGNLIRPLFILVVLAMSGKLAWDAW